MKKDHDIHVLDCDRHINVAGLNMNGLVFILSEYMKEGVFVTVYRILQTVCYV